MRHLKRFNESRDDVYEIGAYTVKKSNNGWEVWYYSTTHIDPRQRTKEPKLQSTHKTEKEAIESANRSHNQDNLMEVGMIPWYNRF